MENEARFNLNKALQDWKAELATQPGIGAENIRELETHLVESVNAFKKRGCSDYAAFSLARQKLGSVQKLGAEFARENLLKVWRDRVFWMTTVIFCWNLIAMMTQPLFEKLAHAVSANLGLSQSWIVLAILGPIPSLLVAIAMATGFAEVIFRRLHWIFARRGRLATTGVIAIFGAAFIASSSSELKGVLPRQVEFEFALVAFAVFIRPRVLALALPTKGAARRRSSITVWRDRLFWAVLAVLAIRTWTLLSLIPVVKLVQMKGWAIINNPWVGAAYLAVWLLPMAAIGLVLASARLSVLAQWMSTRPRVACVTCAFALMWVGAGLWFWLWAPQSDVTQLSAVDWNRLMQGGLLSGTISAVGLIAFALWATPSRAGWHQDVPQFE